MDNLTICTPMRDCAHRLAAYRRQVESLHTPAGLRVIVVEGDSTDNTREALHAWAAADPMVTVLRHDTHGPKWGSVVHPKRFRQLAEVFNVALEAVDLEWSHYVLFLPADIVYQPDLAARLMAHRVDIVAPLVWQNERFYDVWAFSRFGANLPPFTRGQLAEQMAAEPTDLWDMDTVGGTVLLDADVIAEGVRYGKRLVDRELCEQARLLGFGVFADPWTWVWHGMEIET